MKIFLLIITYLTLNVSAVAKTNQDIKVTQPKILIKTPKPVKCKVDIIKFLEENTEEKFLVLPDNKFLIDAINKVRSVPRTCGKMPYTASMPVHKNNAMVIASLAMAFDNSINNRNRFYGSNHWSDPFKEKSHYPDLEEYTSEILHNINPNSENFFDYYDNFSNGDYDLNTQKGASEYIKDLMLDADFCSYVMNPDLTEFGLAGYMDGKGEASIYMIGGQTFVSTTITKIDSDHETKKKKPQVDLHLVAEHKFSQDIADGINVYRTNGINVKGLTIEKSYPIRLSGNVKDGYESLDQSKIVKFIQLKPAMNKFFEKNEIPYRVTDPLPFSFIGTKEQIISLEGEILLFNEIKSNTKLIKKITNPRYSVINFVFEEQGDKIIVAIILGESIAD